MTGLRGWGFAEQHLALDALVAFVDGELSPNAYDRASAHLAGCPTCAADAAAQRQARAAVRSASTPSISPHFLQALQSIPSEAELPSQPEGLALTQDGQLVTVNRPDRVDRTTFGSGSVLGTGPVLGDGQQSLTSSTPLGSEALADDDRGPSQRRVRNAGVMFSGLVLGALALVAVPYDELDPTSPPQPFSDDASFRTSLVPASAPQPIPAAGAPPARPAAPAVQPGAPAAPAPSTTVSATLAPPVPR